MDTGGNIPSRELQAKRTTAAPIFDLISNAIGLPKQKAFQDGPQDRLKHSSVTKTTRTTPAYFALALAIYD
jgi:hypothetical protein